MLKQHYTITINAPVATVRDTMLGHESYRQRTSVFNAAGSRYEGDRSEWSTIKFLWPDPEHPEKVGGMYSKIAANRLHEYISIRHLGEVGTDGNLKENADRADAYENYSFAEKDGTTTVSVDLDITEDFVDYIDQTRPQALQKLKELCEATH